MLILFITIFLGQRALKLKVYDDPNKWHPADDPTVKLNSYIEENFGGANVITVQITVHNGTIFNPVTLGKVKRISDKILDTYGVVPSYLTSLSALKIRYLKGTDDFFDSSILMPKVPANEEEMERLRSIRAI